MRIWISGIAGFLGSHLAEALIAQGHIVRGNDSLICGDANNCIDSSFTRIDCRSYDDMYTHLLAFKPDVLIHTACTAHEGLSNFSPSFITKNVYEASVTTFSAAIAAGVKRIVHLSSMSRYGIGIPPFTEDMPTAPIDPYGIAKVAAEDTLKCLCETHGVKWTIAVPHNIIGIRQRYVDPFRNVAAIMINRCKQGKPPIVYGDGSHKRCFSPIQDCIPSLLKMVDGATDGEIVNIGPDNGEITIKELAERVCNLTGFNGDIQYMPDRPNEVANAYTCSDKARRLLDYQPSQALDDCLKDMVDYIEPKPFVYDFPLEIITNATPKTWRDRLL